MRSRTASGNGRTAALIALAMFLVYNSNGREIASYDSQPTKYAARELLLRGTTSLNYVVGRTPQLLERSGFQLARDGRYRSAYSPVPSIMAAGIMWPLWKTGVVDIQAPRAPGLMAKVASALIVAMAVAVAYLTAVRRISKRRALFVAVAFGLGTSLWSTASQTLWQHETTILGLLIAIYGLMRPGGLSAIAIGLGLGLAASSRLQVAPAVAVLLAATAVIGGWRAGVVATAIASVFIVPMLVLNVKWFGTVFGAAPMLESLHRSVHATSGSFRLQWEGPVGLLVSPNRGLLIYSPIVALTALAIPRAMKEGWRAPVAACLAAAFLQFILYASYTVWWGGHTYGPRYMLDILPLLIPLAIVAAAAFEGRLKVSIAFLLLACSAGVAAVGAFNHPQGRWNNEPEDVDRTHERLWDWSDNQIRRTWNAGPSPQNFSLFTLETFRVPPPQ